MKYLVSNNIRGGKAFLTVENDSSFIVFRVINGDISKDFLPDNIIEGITVAELVADWASQPKRNANELKAAVEFLSQWQHSPKVWIPLSKYAEMYNKEASTVRQKAIRGGFKTAKKICRDWVIDASEPNIDKRRKESNLQ